MKKALLLVLVPALTLWTVAGRVHAFLDDRVPDLATQGRDWGYSARAVLSPDSPRSPSTSSPAGGLEIAQYAPSLYETLQQDPIQERHGNRFQAGDGASGSQAEKAAVPQPKQYHFRGDKPRPEGNPEVEGDYHFRPLTPKERQRNQPASVWRPLSDSPQGTSPSPLPGHNQPRAVFGPPGSDPWGVSGPPDPVKPHENPGRSDLEPENWFDRYYGAGRR